MKNKIHSNFIPAIVMLGAGAIDVICSIIRGLPLLEFLQRLLLVMVIFLVIGLVIKLILDKCIALMADKKQSGESENDSDADTGEKKDGTVGAEK